MMQDMLGCLAPAEGSLEQPVLPLVVVLTPSQQVIESMLVPVLHILAQDSLPFLLTSLLYHSYWRAKCIHQP